MPMKYCNALLTQHDDDAVYEAQVPRRAKYDAAGGIDSPVVNSTPRPIVTTAMKVDMLASSRRVNTSTNV